MRGFLRPTAMTNLRLLAASVVFAVLGVVLLSCGDRGGADPGPGSGSNLDVTYVVTGVTDGGAPRALFKGSEIRLRFTPDQRLGITAGCNSMGGTYALEGTRLTVSDLSMTEMGCAAPLMEQDTWVAGLFGRDVQLMTGPDASLISGDVVLALTDREVASPDRALVGTTWLLDSMIKGTGPDGAVSSVPQSLEYTVRISGDKSYRAQMGCAGSSGGHVVIGAGTIEWNVSVGGSAECAESQLSEQTTGRFMEEIISGATTYEIDEDRLTVTNGDRAVSFRAVEVS